MIWNEKETYILLTVAAPILVACTVAALIDRICR